MKNDTKNLNNLTPSSYILIIVLCSILLYIANIQEQYIEERKILEAQKVAELEKLKQDETQAKKIKQINMKSVSQKKEDFLNLMIPALNKVYNEELELFAKVKDLINSNPNNPSLWKLKEEYNAKSNLELLMALKPHPKSITLAQAAIESAWGESRFFKEANNLFGVWSYSKSEPRIAASSQRGENTIWLRKYKNVEESIKDYYKMLSRSWAFKEFRELNYEKENQNPYLLVEKLEKYSEKRGAYTQELASMISYNQFTKYDAEYYEREKVKKEPEEAIEINSNNLINENIQIKEEKENSLLNNSVEPLENKSNTDLKEDKNAEDQVEEINKELKDPSQINEPAKNVEEDKLLEKQETL